MANHPLIERLLVRIADDEAVAQAAIDGPEYPGGGHPAGSGADWTLAGDRRLTYDNGSSEGYFAVGVDHPAGPWGRIYVKRDLEGLTARHIARHDPARVLAGCAALRRVVERHQPRPQWVEDDPEAQVCSECGEAGGNSPVLWPCPTLRDLAHD